jgi:hypothetical protein
MIKIQLTPEILERAKSYFDFEALPNSITKGGGNIYGAIGEIITLDHYKKLGVKAERANTYDYDLIIDGLKVDVKARPLNKPLRPWNSASIPAYQKQQKTDYYIFVFILKDYSAAWLAGYLSKEDFYTKARLYLKDEPSGFNFNFHLDTYTIISRQLDPITPLKRYTLITENKKA